jgi:hypothetical protein
MDSIRVTEIFSAPETRRDACDPFAPANDGLNSTDND